MSNQYLNALNAQQRQEKASEKARETLKSKGIYFPIFNCSIPPEAYHELLEEYSRQENELVMEFLKEPSGPRPLVIDSVNKKEKYRADWYDD